jgi:hypothetical protein
MDKTSAGRPRTVRVISEQDKLKTKRCCVCKQEKSISEFCTDWKAKDGLFSRCRECGNRVLRIYYASHPDVRIFKEAKSRAKKSGILFTLTLKDIQIPKFCPALGIKLCYGVGRTTDNSPSLDRIIPSKGYVPDNIQVISMRANRIKTDASLRELRRVANYIARHIRKNVNYNERINMGVARPELNCVELSD